ncbi:calcium/sodium antiporter [Kiloniella laminariae]|uniref:Calcium/sodium antiporter n=1 Tax=Kiloniella laminariae TaxID=454162 RepID=A0ABT4LL44_9PROT|nr:calcium/sodium antiporter [Kiloniella laminariae]MCZ4280692.1 calcium/sodium antiporter [Kiloniella laminariae]
MLTFAGIIGGLVLLVLGGDVLVRGASSLSLRFGVSPLLIGLTVVGFGTSTPELVTSLLAASLDLPGIAIGNVVGSNICNILLILGISALIYPMVINRRSFVRDGAVLTVVTLLCVFVLLSGSLERLWGAVFVLLLVGYIVFTYLKEKTAFSEETTDIAADKSIPVPQAGILKALLYTFGGIAVTILGAKLLVDGASGLAIEAGISEALIGVTIVAIGTSLPELVTSVIAALKRQTDIALGNVIGSNIYNVLGILGITALVEPVVVPAEIAGTDVWVMLGATGLLIIFSVFGWKISRLKGGLLLGGYGGYLGYLVIPLV